MFIDLHEQRSFEHAALWDGDLTPDKFNFALVRQQFNLDIFVIVVGLVYQLVGVHIAYGLTLLEIKLSGQMEHGGLDVVALVDNATSPEPAHATPDRWPVRSVGRFVHPWDFDDILAVLGAAPDHLATSAMARTVPCHLWIEDGAVVGARFGANLQALEIARSVIVGSIEAAHQLRRAADRSCPILVIPPTASDDEAATALAGWLVEAVDLDPSTIRQTQPDPAAGAEPSPISSPDP